MSKVEMKEVRLLLVEDEYQLLKAIRTFLEEEKYVVVAVETYRSAQQEIKNENYDVCLIDINLPDGSGNSLINLIKSKHRKTGIIIISSHNMTEDKVQSLDLGADDYLTKPFDLHELNARIRSVLRRKLGDNRHQVVSESISVYPNEFKAFVHDVELELTKKEFEMLLYLMSNKNRLITKESLAAHLWGISIEFSDNYDYIYTHVKNLRKKLLNAGATDNIKNVHGIGYRFEVA
jgi:DNA-binding response OmpR family regulator